MRMSVQTPLPQTPALQLVGKAVPAPASLSALAGVPAPAGVPARQPRLTRWAKIFGQGAATSGDAKWHQLRESTVLAACTDRELVTLGRVADLISARPGQPLVDQGEPGQWWWLLLDGVVDVAVDGVVVSELRPGDRFGPNNPGVVQLAPVTLTARSEVVVLCARHRDLESLDRAGGALAQLTGRDGCGHPVTIDVDALTTGARRRQAV